MNFIFGMGDDNSDIVFISESPGCLNNPQELLFLGDASKLFDKMLKAMINLKEKIYIYLNILKTNFKNESKFNRNDTDARNLKNYIYEKLQLVKPKVIIFLGDSIYKKIINKNNFEDLRKKVFKFLNVDCLMTYHPNILIRKNELKKNAWEDFKILRDNYLNDK